MPELHGPPAVRRLGARRRRGPLQAARAAGGAILLSAAAAPLAAQQHPGAIAAERHSALSVAAARVAPAVVSVNVVRRERALPRTVFDLFFLPPGSEQIVQGLGSGFIVSRDGLVITNQHVVSGADSIVVTLRDGRTFPAKLLGEDARNDIAVVKVDGTGFPVARIGRSSDLDIGDWVIAIGNPYGYLLGNSEPSVTAGVVSALRRSVLPTSQQPGLYLDMIQTDAAINPGNSGGPLVNAQGEVVGVNSFILSESGGNVGLGFAIPIERAMRIARDLRDYHKVLRGWTGVEIVEPGANSDSWRRQPGVAVERVAPGSPAAAAGLAAGDTITRVGDQPVRNYLDWEGAQLDLERGDTLHFAYRRDGAAHVVAMRAVELPSERAQLVTLGDLQLITVTPAIQTERHLDVAQGALVVGVGPETQDLLGVQAGDVIVRINNEAVTGAEQVKKLFDYFRVRGGGRLFFERGGQYGWADF
jgi:serine protease Do